MVVKVALPAAERQQIGILDKCLLQTLAEAAGIEAGLLCLDNDIEVDRPRPGRSNCGGRSRPQVCRRFSAISALPWRPHRCPRSHGQWRMTGHGNDSDTEGTLREELTRERFLAVAGVH
jgi:hypothetical protein